MSRGEKANVFAVGNQDTLKAHMQKRIKPAQIQIYVKKMEVHEKSNKTLNKWPIDSEV